MRYRLTLSVFAECDSDSESEELCPGGLPLEMEDFDEVRLHLLEWVDGAEFSPYDEIREFLNRLEAEAPVVERVLSKR